MLETDTILVSMKKAAELLSLGRGTLYKLLNSGELRAVKSGGRTLIPAQVLRDYADSLSSYLPRAKAGEATTPPPAVDAVPVARRMLNLNQVMKRTGLARREVFKRSSAGTFPVGVPRSKGTLGWQPSDVDEWLADPANYQAKAYRSDPGTP